MQDAQRDLDNSRISPVITPVNQSNELCAHSENFLLVMISDERPHVRELAWRRGTRARAEQCDHAAEDQAVNRKFVVPELNLKCGDYTNIMNGSRVVVT